MLDVAGPFDPDLIANPIGNRTPARSHAVLRLLTFGTLYPNAAQPNHGVFVENRLRHLVATGKAVSTVMAPVAWYPRGVPGPAAWAKLAHIPAIEQRHGLTVHHPRYAVIPRIGMSTAPSLLYWGALRAVRRLQAVGLVVDAIDAHYVYPDGVAAVRLGQTLGLPVVVTARGSDVTQLPDHASPRQMIRWALRRADALIAVSAALGAQMVALGADPARVTVLRNGVSSSQFHPPVDRAASRTVLGIEGPTLLSVGHLIPRKGHDRVIEALALLPDTIRLLVVGEGPLDTELRALAKRRGVAARVRFLGAVPHAELAVVYGAVDALVLASSREGWANVLLEAMACGTPVVASPIPGNDEVVTAPAAGIIAAENTPAGLAAAVLALLAALSTRAQTRLYAEAFGWEDTSAGQLAVFRRVLAARSPYRADAPRGIGNQLAAGI
jgi:teichuronic acid biosynthesis glycosyltransferase TuaC